MITVEKIGILIKGKNMPRPKTKTELIEASNSSYQKIVDLIANLPEETRSEDFNFDTSKLKEAHWKRDHNVRDVLVHLYEWQRLLLDWIKNNQSGKEQDFLPAGYNWRNYGEMNQQFWQKHQTTSLPEAEKLLAQSHKETMKLLDTFSEEQLFQKKVFPWTGNNALATYFIANTSSHYDWALKKLRKFQRSLKKK